jgi:hypothetical protein
VIYFAVKDVSVIGQHTGNIHPFNQSDSLNAANDHVKTINYMIASSLQPNSPTSLVIIE